MVNKDYTAIVLVVVRSGVTDASYSDEDRNNSMQ